MDRGPPQSRCCPQLTSSNLASPTCFVAIVSVHEHTVSFFAMTHPTTAQSDLVLALREEFRAHLEMFYSQLKLAPPYESVEKAIRSLTTTVHGLPNAQDRKSVV